MTTAACCRGSRWRVRRRRWASQSEVPEQTRCALLVRHLVQQRNQIRRRFCGRQPLCGTGVTSEIELMRMPRATSARIEDSRPGRGPLICTSRFFMPCSIAAGPATSEATCAAKGVDLREPLKPWPPDEAHDSALPWRSVIVMMVLLKDACTWQMPSDTFLRTFLRTRCAALETGALAMSCSLFRR